MRPARVYYDKRKKRYFLRKGNKRNYLTDSLAKKILSKDESVSQRQFAKIVNKIVINNVNPRKKSTKRTAKRTSKSLFELYLPNFQKVKFDAYNQVERLKRLIAENNRPVRGSVNPIAGRVRTKFYNLPRRRAEQSAKQRAERLVKEDVLRANTNRNAPLRNAPLNDAPLVTSERETERRAASTSEFSGIELEDKEIGKSIKRSKRERSARLKTEGDPLSKKLGDQFSDTDEGDETEQKFFDLDEDTPGGGVGAVDPTSAGGAGGSKDPTSAGGAVDPTSAGGAGGSKDPTGGPFSKEMTSREISDLNDNAIVLTVPNTEGEKVQCIYVGRRGARKASQCVQHTKSLRRLCARHTKFNNCATGRVSQGRIDKALYDSELIAMLAPYHEFVGVCMLDEVYDLLRQFEDRERFGFVMNTAMRKERGEHWVGVYLDLTRETGQICYYDSFAEEMPKLLRDSLETFVDEKGLPWKLKMKENTLVHQEDKSQKCGYHVARFLSIMFKTGDFVKATEFDLKSGESLAEEDAKSFRAFGYI